MTLYPDESEMQKDELEEKLWSFEQFNFATI
jgi:DNA polymerase IIIc chi subunit